MRDDKDVMRAHFNLMRERGERIDPPNLPVCMTRWHAFEQREELDKAAGSSSSRRTAARARAAHRRAPPPSRSTS